MAPRVKTMGPFLCAAAQIVSQMLPPKSEPSLIGRWEPALRQKEVRQAFAGNA